MDIHETNIQNYQLKSKVHQRYMYLPFYTRDSTEKDCCAHKRFAIIFTIISIVHTTAFVSNCHTVSIELSFSSLALFLALQHVPMELIHLNTHPVHDQFLTTFKFNVNDIIICDNLTAYHAMCFHIIHAQY